MTPTFKVEYKIGDKVISLTKLQVSNTKEAVVSKGEELIVLLIKEDAVSILTQGGKIFDVPNSLIIPADENAYQPFVNQIFDCLKIKAQIE